MKRWMAATILLLMILEGGMWAQDAQWRGPDRNGIYPDTGLLKQWPEGGPELLFTAEGLGKGHGSAVAAAGRIYVCGLVDTLEYLSALDEHGTLLWQMAYGRSWDQSFPDARCTPLVSKGRVFVLSGRDMLACLDAESGETLWRADLHETYRSHWDMFGVSESLLLVDGKIIVTPGGEQTTIIALDEATGEPVWKSESLGAQRSNMSPLLISHAGREYIIASTRTHVLSVDPSTGDIYWKYHYNVLTEEGENSTIISNTPTYADSCLWLTSGWDKESVMLEMAPDGLSVKEKFRDRTFDNQNHGVVLLDGYVYGSNFTDRNMGKWVCMNFATGEIVWIGEFHNKGPIIAADGMLYIYEEKRGHLGLVHATPEAFEVISSFRVTAGAGPHWARPSIYDGRLMVRHGQTLSVYQIKQE